MTERSFSWIGENLRRITDQVRETADKAGRNPDSVQIMAVTKTVEPEAVNAAIDCGIRLLGENRAQELLQKADHYHKEATVHFIGHLQTNKVRQIIDKVEMIQSVGSLKLAGEIHRQAAQKLGRPMDVLLEINLGGELSKSGAAPGDTEELVRRLAGFSHLKLQGLMAIPPICANLLETERYFNRMQQLLVDIRAKKIDNVNMNILSMGMSGDYFCAIKHGATIVRLGTILFGRRQ